MSDPPGIRIRSNGPYVLSGLPVCRLRVDTSPAGDPIGWTVGPELAAAEPGSSDAGQSAKPTALCRCGQSGTKPFCDGTHRGQFDGDDTGSAADGEAGAYPELEPELDPGLAPAVGVIDDGPLWVTGSVPLQLSDGRRIATGPRLLLCRCGGSANKPYCDGSHAGHSASTRGPA